MFISKPVDVLFLSLILKFPYFFFIKQILGSFKISSVYWHNSFFFFPKVGALTCSKLLNFFPWARRNQVCMLINILQSLTCDYVGCILSTCQKIKSNTLLHLCKDFLHFFCTLTAQEKTDFGISVQHNKTVYITCLNGGRKDTTYIYFNLWGHEKSSDRDLQSTMCNMNLLM